MEIYLIRHTQAADAAGLCYGQTDVGLADSFPEDLQAVADKLPDFADDCRVFSSPLSRCVQLAENLFDQVDTDARIQELYFGDWEGQRFEGIDAAALQHWMDNFATEKPPNGESFADLYQRTGEFWQQLMTIDAAQVVIVTHAGVIRALLARVLNLPPTSAFQFRIDAGSVHKLQCLANYTYIDYINL
ncbi:MAG: alpha-ribazole phosphatase [Methylococcaceae bacterium]|nr:alpha-ribazole phosphatase [Methylococcaceae bacterium]